MNTDTLPPRLFYLFTLLLCYVGRTTALATCQDHLISQHRLPFEFNDVKISPDLPETGDSFDVTFEATVKHEIKRPMVKFSLYALGILIDEETVHLCSEGAREGDDFNDVYTSQARFEDEMLGEQARKTKGNRIRCPLIAGQVIEGVFRHQLAKEVPENVPLTIQLQLVDERSDEDVSSCVEETVVVKESKKVAAEKEASGMLNERFGFEAEEVDFLFSLWYKQHEENIFVPQPSVHHQRLDFLNTKVGGEMRKGMEKLNGRKDIFVQNLIAIAEHNANPKNKWKKAMNQFGHLTPKEFKKIYASGMRDDITSSAQKQKERVSLYHSSRSLHQTNLRSFRTASKRSERESLVTDRLGELPKEVNWVKGGAVTPVKNQGACGSCWSFAATGALEGAYFLKYKKLVSFSEQELVACDHTDLGCNGGAMDSAFDFASTKHGLCTEEDFPYSAGEGVRGFCNVSCTAVQGSEPTGIVDVDHDEVSLLQAVAKQPVAVAIEADEEAFQFYSSGVLTAQCSQQLDHGVLVAGYGVEQVSDEISGEMKDVDYWLVKNSWGPMWGLDGYIKLERGVELAEGGECGILLGPSYPLL